MLDNSFGNGEAVAEANTRVHSCYQNAKPAAPKSYRAMVKAKIPSLCHLQSI